MCVTTSSVLHMCVCVCVYMCVMGCAVLRYQISNQRYKLNKHTHNIIVMLTGR